MVRAAGGGRVSYAGLLAGRGVVVVVHGDLRTTYEPVTASVTVGDQVAAGQGIGPLEAGHAGCPVAACLHWGLRRGEDYLDPVTLVDRGPARLLPLGGATGAGGPPDAAPGEAGIAAAPSAPTDPIPAPVPPDGGPAEPGSAWSLRAAQAPLGLVAVAALVAGIGLLARPRPGPHAPAGGAAAPVVAAEDVPVGPDALLLDLRAAKLRREAS